MPIAKKHSSNWRSFEAVRKRNALQGATYVYQSLNLAQQHSLTLSIVLVLRQLWLRMPEHFDRNPAIGHEERAGGGGRWQVSPLLSEEIGR
jgi:hypothetical protein